VTDEQQKRAGTAPTMSVPTTGEKPGDAAPVRKVPWVAIGLAVTGLAALGGAAAVIAGKNSDKPSDEPTYVVVDQRGSADKPVEKPIEKPPEVPVIAVDAAVEAAAPPIDAGHRTSNKIPAADLAATLTSAFARQNTAITSCFKQHPTKYEGKISIRFQVDAKGQVTNAEVTPSSVGATPLGACISAIAKRTSFGPQPQPIVFSVPLVTIEN
jgi:TonB family protein